MNNLKNIREKVGMTQIELATFLWQCPASQVSLIEQGKVLPWPTPRMEIEMVLKHPVRWFDPVPVNLFKALQKYIGDDRYDVSNYHKIKQCITQIYNNDFLSESKIENHNLFLESCYQKPKKNNEF